MHPEWQYPKLEQPTEKKHIFTIECKPGVADKQRSIGYYEQIIYWKPLNKDNTDNIQLQWTPFCPRTHLWAYNCSL